MKASLAIVILTFSSGLAAADPPGLKTLPIGASAPDFQLPGVDGKTYTPEGLRRRQGAGRRSSPATTARPPRPTRSGSPGSHADYKDKGVAVVAISPNDPTAVRLDELGYTDLGDSFEDMKIRAKDHKFTYPYLYDGETQATAEGLRRPRHAARLRLRRRPQAPLRRPVRRRGGQGRSSRTTPVNAVEALLAGKPVPVEKTRVFGCSTKWADKQADAAQVAGEVGRRAGHARADRRRRRRQARQERHQEAAPWSTSGRPGAAPASPSCPSSSR